MKECKCGHGRDMHEHYHARTYCSLCLCPSFSGKWVPRFLMRWF